MGATLTKDMVVAALTKLLGEPEKTLKKIVGWTLSPRLDVVVQLDSRQADEDIYVLVPADESSVTPIDCPCDLYAAGKTRHHNVARFRSLGKRRWAIRFRPREVHDVSHAIVEVIHRLMREDTPTRDARRRRFVPRGRRK